MNAFKCDRCGKLFEEYQKRKSEGNYKIVRNSNNIVRYLYLDLCENCNNELQDWVNAFKKKEEGDILNETNNDV